MAKNKKVKTEVKEKVVEQVTETAEETPKKKLNLKKVALVAGGAVAAVGAVAGAILFKKHSDKELLNYMESCGNEGTDLDDDPDAGEPDGDEPEDNN